MIHVKHADRISKWIRTDVSRETFLTPEIGVPNRPHDRGLDDVR